MAASRSGKTLLLSMDLDTVDDRPGLSDYIAGAVTRPDSILRATTATFFELGRGTMSLDPYTALGDPRMSQLFDVLRRDFDTIVLAAPSVLDAAEGPLACSIADDVVLVVEEARSRTQDVVQSLHMLGLVVKTPVRLVMVQRPALWRRRSRRSVDALESEHLGHGRGSSRRPAERADTCLRSAVSPRHDERHDERHGERHRRSAVAGRPSRPGARARTPAACLVTRTSWDG